MQGACDRGTRKQRRNGWSAEQASHLCHRWAEGALAPTIAAELGMTPGAVASKALREGLGSRRQLQQNI